MSRAEIVATAMADKLFAKRRGHGSTEGIVERHLRRGQLMEIIKIAYEAGYRDCARDAKAPAKESR